MKIVIIGTGYVGLVSGVCLASLGHRVVCVDRQSSRIQSLQQGKVPIYEPGLESLMAEVCVSGALSFDTQLSPAIDDADAVFIAVGTPADPLTGAADLSQVECAARDIAQHCDHYMVVVTKSTVPVGTNQRVKDILLAAGCDNVDVASNPEFLREGAAIEDFMNPDRVVVGTDSAQAQSVMSEIYQPLENRGHCVQHTDTVSAELIKYASNAFLATKITYANQIAQLCAAVGADVDAVTAGMGSDSRIGSAFLQPGPGYGGSCFPKDTLALAYMGQQWQTPQTIVETVIEANRGIRRSLVMQAQKAAGGDLSGRTVAVWGASFKAHTDDVREAASLTVVPALQELGATVRVCDPVAQANAQPLLPNVHWYNDPVQSAQDAHCVIVLTEWPLFAEVDLNQLASVMAQPCMVDFRRIYTESALRSAGFSHK